MVGAGISAFNSKEISAPARGRVEVCCQRPKWDCQFSGPGALLTVQRNRTLHPAPQVNLTIGKNVKIDPQTVRTDFKFLVELRLLRIRLQKHFSDIPLPESITAAAFLSIIKQKQFAVAAFKTHVQSLGRPH